MREAWCETELNSVCREQEMNLNLSRGGIGLESTELPPTTSELSPALGLGSGMSLEAAYLLLPVLFK